MKTMLTLFAAVFALVTLTACGQQTAAMTTPIDVDIAMRVEPEPLAVGETTLIVTLNNGSGSRVDGANLQVHGNMDHAGMTPVEREVSESTNGEYRVPFEWTMGGGWIVTITAQLSDNGGEASASFEFFVEAVSSESVINHSGEMNMTDMTAEGTPESNASTGDVVVNISYEMDHAPTITADDTATITLTDADKSPITDATVEVEGNMAHAGMMPISGRGTHTENGQYAVPLRWTMAGEWQMRVSVTLADGRHFEQTFDQTIVMP
jgi:hypothetical protein